MVLILAISWLAISNLSQANERADSLYRTDMVGATYANGITIDIYAIKGADLNAMARASDPAAVEASEKDELASAAELHANLDGADKLLVTKKGIEQLDIIRKAMPAYEQAQAELFHALKAKDIAAAEAPLATAVQCRTMILAASNEARTLKQEHAEQELEASNQAYQSSRTLMIGASAVSVVLSLILSFVIARGFSAPLGHAVATLEQVAGGDLTVTLDVHTKDEVGRMAAALNDALEKLRSTLEEVTQGAMNVSSASQQLASASQAIASGSQEQAASLEETSASLEEITAAVRQSADNARQASQLASGSRDAAEQGQEVVSHAVTAMAEISAGEEGRGFAVVAAEVRSLAQRSAEAAKEIKTLIQDSLRKVERGTGLVNKSGETLHGIVSSVKRVTDIVGEIAAAAGEQSTGIEQVNTAMTQMDQVTQSNSAQTEELSSTAESLSDQSRGLMELVQIFTLNKGGKQAHSPSATRRSSAAASAVPAKVRTAFSARVAQHGKKDAPGAAKQAASALQPAAAMAHAGGADDASFEEF
jgi:methyl-accepting chemotaxis protein